MLSSLAKKVVLSSLVKKAFIFMDVFKTPKIVFVKAGTINRKID